jgi:hypothetical protein
LLFVLNIFLVSTFKQLPFLLLQIRPDLGRIEKWVLRKAFDDEEEPFLPKVTFKFKLLLH